jgi:prepilin-type N-terminal cleavage/methylation domain-containing protein
MKSRQAGFTLTEMLVSVVIGAMLVTSLFKLWNTNRLQTDLIMTKSDFRDRATLATTAVNRALTMAGFGLSKIDVIELGSSQATDTLTVYSNAEERRTTIRDTAHYGAAEIIVFKDSGFVAGALIGITDSLQQEYVRVVGITGDSGSGFRFTVSPSLRHRYLPGVPDVFPVQRDRIYIDGDDSALVRMADGRRMVLAQGISEFRVDLRDAAGAPATLCKNIRVITFSIAGSYKASAGTPNLMRFSSTVIPRNIL